MANGDPDARGHKAEADPQVRGHKATADANSGPSTIGYTLQRDGTLHYRTTYGDRVCLPKDMIVDCLRMAHDALGHFGVDKTYCNGSRITRTIYKDGKET
jgi:hypothetical protein